MLTAVAAIAGLAAGPWLATSTRRLATRDPAARAGRARVLVTALLTGILLALVVARSDVRPATLGVAWFAAAAVLLAGVDLASHRLPDRVTLPTAGIVAATLLVDGAVTGDRDDVLRAGAAGASAYLVSALLRLASPRSLGGGDVKLLLVIGLVLGWRGWGVLVDGVFAGLVLGALASVVLLLSRRAGWRTAIPFGPPLLAGALLSVLLAGPA